MGTTTIQPIDNLSGLPAYSATNERQGFAALMGGGSGRQLGARPGLRLGTPSNLITVTGTTWTAGTEFAAVLDPASSTTQGPYRYAYTPLPSADSGSITPADPTYPRKDIIVIRVDDASAGDSSGARQAPLVYRAGPATSMTPTAPALNPREFLVGTITVPQGGGGSPTFTLNKQFFVSAGAPQQVFSKAERDALTAYDGLEVLRMDALGIRQRSIGGQWLGGEHAEFSGSFGVTSGSTWGPGPLSKTPSTTYLVTQPSFLDDLVTSPTNDVINVPPGVFNLDWRIKFFDDAARTNGKNIADSTSFLQILDGAGNELKSRDLANGKSADSISVTEVYFPTGGSFQCKLTTNTTGLYSRSAIRVGRSK